MYVLRTNAYHIFWWHNQQWEKSLENTKNEKHRVENPLKYSIFCWATYSVWQFIVFQRKWFKCAFFYKKKTFEIEKKKFTILKWISYTQWILEAFSRRNYFIAFVVFNEKGKLFSFMKYYRRIMRSMGNKWLHTKSMQRFEL